MSTPGHATTLGMFGLTVGSEPVAARSSELGSGTLVGRYEIIRLLGRGGMGAVYAAHDPNLDRQVALKILHSTRLREARERMIVEAHALARLDDPQVVQVYDAGELADQVFIAMQLVDGEDLAAAVVRRRPNAAQLLAWYCAAGRGLAAAHAAGVVHRDFKPSNVLLDRRGRIAVTDFGLARWLGADDAGRRRITARNAFMGTPAYMSPEQHALLTATPASDQFSFCVALWEALYERHPLIPGEHARIVAMSPTEIGYHIYACELIEPPRHKRVAKRVHDALLRGLAHDPAARWPTMMDLVAQLEPAQRPRWPLAAAAVLAAAGTAGAWLAVANERQQIASCDLHSANRATTAWTSTTAHQLHAQFTKSGKPYAEAAGRSAVGALDGYASHWRQLATDVCEAERAVSGEVPTLLVRKQACLDRRLDALRVLANLLTTEARLEFVDRATAMVESLPALADCAEDRLPSSPPPAIASEVTELERGLDDAEARLAAGDWWTSEQAALPILERARQLHWQPLHARASLLLGAVRMGQMQPARELLLTAVELATANNMDREAARALALAQHAAGIERAEQAFATLVPVARAAALRTRDAALIARAEIKRGRALVRLRRSAEAADTCRRVYASTETALHSVRSDARDCLLEALASHGPSEELTTVLAQAIADKTRELGAEHPQVADFIGLRAHLHVRQGRIAEARADALLALAIRKRRYPEKHYRIAEALHQLAQVEEAEGNVARAGALDDEALAMLDEDKPEQIGLVTNVLVHRASRDHRGGNHEAALARLERAVSLLRKHLGADSYEVAIVLLNYGQLKSMHDVEAGLRMIDEARTILERHGDKRAAVAGTAAMIVAFRVARYADVVRIGNETVPLLEQGRPEDTARTKSLLARALVETNGDKARAKQLAREARDIFARLGVTHADSVKVLDTLLASLR